jgi:hypothetical protein
LPLTSGTAAGPAPACSADSVMLASDATISAHCPVGAVTAQALANI